MQIWAESGKSALPICNYSQILYQFLTFTQNLKRSLIRFRFHLDPYDRNTLFLFCGKRTYRIKGLLLEEDGFLLLYKRLDTGAFNWSRSKEEALAITPEQYAMLMQGLEIVARHYNSSALSE